MTYFIEVNDIQKEAYLKDFLADNAIAFETLNEKEVQAIKCVRGEHDFVKLIESDRTCSHCGKPENK